MRVVIVGGTRFVGRSVVDELVAAGHDVLVVHRGEHEPPGLPDVPHLHADRRVLADHRDALTRFRPDGLVDLSAMTAADARHVLDAVGGDVRLVVASSMDVYRAFSSLHAGDTTDAVPLTEDAALRTEPPPDARGPMPDGWDVEAGAYDKLDVERAYLDRDAVVCRLPFVYGAHDYQRREEFVLRRVRAGRTRMPIGPGGFLISRGHAPELARGMRLALESTLTREVLNLCEPACAPMRLWAQQIVAAAAGSGWSTLELVGVASSALPADLALTGDLSQHVLADPGRAARLLGWVHAAAEPCVVRSVAWHLAHPPQPPQDDLADDFTADDTALDTIG